MNARTLVGTRCLAWIRRGTRGGVFTGALASLIGAVAVLGAAWVTQGWGQAAAQDVERVRNHLFWLTVLQVFVFAYTTFEVAFRAGDRRFVALLPIEGSTRWADLSLRNLVVHLPLLAPGGGYIWGLARAQNPELAIYGAALFVGTYGGGIPLCGWLHLRAGRSLLEPAGAGRRLLAGATVPADAALLLYTPALGLAGTLCGVLVIDGTLRAALVRDDGSLSSTALWATLTSCVLGAVLFFRAAGEAKGVLHRIAARFSEVDVPGPYRDDGLPERTAGMGWERLLPTLARPFFGRDLKQLRRRFRLDRVLMWLACAAALRVGWVANDPTAAYRELMVIAALTTLLACHGPLATEGPELGSRWLRSSLPCPEWPRALGSLVSFATGATWPWLFAAVAGWMVGGAPGAATLAVAGAAVVLAVWAVAWTIARTASPERLGGLSVVFHSVGIVMIGWAAGRFV